MRSKNYTAAEKHFLKLSERKDKQLKLLGNALASLEKDNALLKEQLATAESRCVELSEELSALRKISALSKDELDSLLKRKQAMQLFDCDSLCKAVLTYVNTGEVK